jgi:hypothetical protein
MRESSWIEGHVKGGGDIAVLESLGFSDVEALSQISDKHHSQTSLIKVLPKVSKIENSR